MILQFSIIMGSCKSITYIQRDSKKQSKRQQRTEESNTQLYGPIQLDPKAYRFFPNQKQQKTERTKKGVRFFFYGQITHDEYEKKKLKQFHQYLEHHDINYDSQFFDDQKLLLYYQGNHYKAKQALEQMHKHLQFRKQYLPVPFQAVSSPISRGFFYPTGRDKYFRPILVFNASIIDWQNLQTYIQSAIFVHQMIIDRMLIPGQVQTWVIIYDLGGIGIMDMPINAIRAVSEKMSTNFSGRLGKLYIVNAPGTMWFGWKTVSAFLEPVTVNKIKLTKSNCEQSIFQIADPSQIQQKYGGTQPNRTQYWPFKIPPGVYDQSRLLSDEQYLTMLNEGKLARNVIDPKFKK